MAGTTPAPPSTIAANPAPMSGQAVVLNHWEPNINDPNGKPTTTALTVSIDSASLTITYLGNDFNYHIIATPKEFAALSSLQGSFLTPSPSASSFSRITSTQEKTSSKDSTFSPPTTSSTRAGQPTSTARSQQPTKGTQTTSLATQPAPQTSTQVAKSNGLSTAGTAGVVIGASVGLALIACLLTWLFMHRRQRRKQGVFEAYGSSTSKTKGLSQNGYEKSHPPVDVQSLALRGTSDLGPQPADDMTICTRFKTVIDHLELFVENFYSQEPGLRTRKPNVDIKRLSSYPFSRPLDSLIEEARNAIPLIVHALVFATMNATSSAAGPENSLLPMEYTSIPYEAGKQSAPRAKSGKDFARKISRWRLLTALLLPSLGSDPRYLRIRDEKVQDLARTFVQTFQPWAKPTFRDEDRLLSLSAILQEAVDLGLFLYSQPSDITFHWPPHDSMRTNEIVTTPDLIKTTNEGGEPLREAQVLVPAIIKKI